jgi:hypothetical protein
MSANGGQDAAWLDYIIFPPVDTGVGIVENLAKYPEMLVYPNPANNKTMLYSGKAGQGSSIQIVDISGRIITQFVNISPDQFIEVNLSGIAPGIYFIRNTGQIPLKTVKLIIQ